MTEVLQTEEQATKPALSKINQNIVNFWLKWARTTADKSNTKAQTVDHILKAAARLGQQQRNHEVADALLPDTELELERSLCQNFANLLTGSGGDRGKRDNAVVQYIVDLYKLLDHNEKKIAAKSGRMPESGIAPTDANGMSEARTATFQPMLAYL